MKINHMALAALCASFLLLGGCAVMSSMKTVTECNFAFAGLDSFSYAGVKLDKLANPSSLSLTDTINILTALRDKNAKLTFNALVDIDNPNSGSASVEKMDWKLFLEGKELLAGVNKDTIKIDPNSKTKATIQANIDPSNVLNGGTLEDLWTLYCKLSGRETSKKANLMLQLKPTVGGRSYPDYLKLEKTL
ncbi:LEA type 2 family protein [bacterium]|nr:LEA type 2 family protein [bacterium]